LFTAEQTVATFSGFTLNKLTGRRQEVAQLLWSLVDDSTVTSTPALCVQTIHSPPFHFSLSSLFAHIVPSDNLFSNLLVTLICPLNPFTRFLLRACRMVRRWTSTDSATGRSLPLLAICFSHPLDQPPLPCFTRPPSQSVRLVDTAGSIRPRSLSTAHQLLLLLLRLLLLLLLLGLLSLSYSNAQLDDHEMPKVACSVAPYSPSPVQKHRFLLLSLSLSLSLFCSTLDSLANPNP
jgi:hypothetical protein